MRYLAIIAVLLSTAAMAQDGQKPVTDVPANMGVVPYSPLPTSSPQPAPAPQRFYLELEQSDIQAIGTALNELPKRVADPIILKLNGQLNQQAQAQIQANRAKAIAEPAKVDPPKDSSDAKDEVLAHRARRHRT